MKQEAELTEMKHILERTGQFFDEADMAVAQADAPSGTSAPLLSGEDGRGKLGFITGTIPREKANSFERLMWRACRGNVFMRRVALEDKLMDAAKGEAVLKDLFIVFFQGSQLELRVRKICEGFQATQYPCPESTVERREMCTEVDTRLMDLQSVLATTNDHLKNILGRIAYQLSGWQVKVSYVTLCFASTITTRRTASVSDRTS